MIERSSIADRSDAGKPGAPDVNDAGQPIAAGRYGISPSVLVAEIESTLEGRARMQAARERLAQRRRLAALRRVAGAQ